MNALESKPDVLPAGKPRELIAGLWGVTKTFDSYLSRALAGVNLEIRRGEVLGVFGPAGSGKSTVLRLLAGRLRPTEGQVKVFGWSPRRAAARARIGYLPEQNARPDSVGLFGLFGRSGDKTVPRPSPGDGAVAGRRAALSQAVLGSRDLVLLDEPFARLDSVGRRDMRDLILGLRQRGQTVVFSSDLLTDAAGLCDRLAFFYEGRLQAAGTLDELLSEPDAIRFTAPVLSAVLSHRVLALIRDETLDEDAALSAAYRNPAPAQPREETSRLETAATATAAEAILTRLLQTDAPAPAPKTSGQHADPVDHAKLEQLTKPGADQNARR